MVPWKQMTWTDKIAMLSLGPFIMPPTCPPPPCSTTGSLLGVRDCLRGLWSFLQDIRSKWFRKWDSCYYSASLPLQPGGQWLQQCPQPLHCGPLLQSQLEGRVAFGLALRTQVKVCSWVPGPEEGIAESHTGPDLGPGKSLTS